jgi:tRNA A37 threonylcarbamoyladenosine synthetase subunit TsaC/SUA5/YrdC
MIYILPTDTCFWLACPITHYKDYEKIYKIKKRPFQKPLAILLQDFNQLQKYTQLTKQQIDFLKNYKKPFTILTESNYIKIWLNFVNEETWEEFRNRTIYEKIALRIANNDIEKKLIKEKWLLFLTSANISNKWEIYSSK